MSWRPKRFSFVAALMLLLLGGGTARGAQWYVATTGTPSGAGTLASPWDLQTGLNGQPPISPGDTIWVRGGVYLGPFTSYLKGTPLQPIVVRSYNRERVIIDSQYYECDQSKCPPPEWQAAHPWLPPCPNALGEVHNYQCTGAAPDCWCDPAKGRCGLIANSTTSGLRIPTCSHDAWFWGLEVTSAEDGGRVEPVPSGCSSSNPLPGCCWINGIFRPECDGVGIRRSFLTLEIYGDNIRLINSFVHDLGVGIGWWVPSENSEVYGSFAFNNGWMGVVRGRAHGTYNQALDCSDRPSTKTWRDTVFFDNFDLGLQAYSAACAPVNNVVVDGVVSFDNKMPTKVFYAHADPTLWPTYLQYEFAEQIYVGSNLGARGCTIRDTHTYAKMADVRDSGINLRASGGSMGVADLLVENSTFAGNLAPVTLSSVSMLRFTGNRIVGNTGMQSDAALVQLVEQRHPAEHLPNFFFDDNAYYRTDGSPVNLGLYDSVGHTTIPFSAWQSSYGWDLHGTAAVGLPPTNWVYVRPNAYEAGRAHVVVYNWQNLSSVSVDLSGIGLNEGQAFKIYNVQRFKTDLNVNDPDYYGDVVGSGTFHAASPSATISMAYADATVPIGFPYSPIPSSLPEFGTYLVLGQ